MASAFLIINYLDVVVRLAREELQALAQLDIRILQHGEFGGELFVLF
jgi:hypothetical protein